MGSGASVVHKFDDSTIADGSLPFPKDGVRLSFIQEFFNFCGGREKLEGLTTTDVCNEFVKPATESSQLSFCEYLKFQNHGAVAKAEVFISHGILIFQFFY